jgi:hypothetical protein
MGRDLKRILKLLDLSDEEEITPSVRSALQYWYTLL